MEPDNPQWKLLETVWKLEGPSGSPLSEPFWKLPSRRIYPDYYKEIKNPLSLIQIRNKLTKKAYGTVSEVAGDMTIMFENAKKYNIPNSKLYKVKRYLLYCCIENIFLIFNCYFYVMFFNFVGCCETPKTDANQSARTT